MEIHLTRKNEAFHFEAENPEGNTVQIDAKEKVGGEGKGMRPMQLILAGLASCSAIDVGLILKKQKQDVKDFQIRVRADRAEKAPTVFTDIYLEFLFKGDIDPAKIERAISLSINKYCPVSHMLAKTANIHTSYQVEPA